MDEGYGRELFASFVPSSARGRLATAATPLLSGALLARHAGELQGALVELPLLPRAALAGALRAAKHADAVVAISVPYDVWGASPRAPHQAVDSVMSAAHAALLDRPLVVVARSRPLGAGEPVDRLEEGLYRVVEAGFTSVAFAPAALSGDVDTLLRVVAPVVEQDLGIELDLDDGGSKQPYTAGDAALVLARLDDAGLKLSAVRGANAMDELGGAFLVVEHPDVSPSGTGAPLRVSGDKTLSLALARVSGDDAQEACAWHETTAIIEDARASGTSSRLLDALAKTMKA